MSGNWYHTYGKTDGMDLIDRLKKEHLVDDVMLDQLRERIKDERVIVSRLKCERCGAEILSVFDKWNENQWWGYLGNQAAKAKTYTYSTIVNVLRMLNGGWDFDSDRPMSWPNNPLYNVHARIHTKPVKDYSMICKPNSIHMLCNECFRKTYRRVKIYQKDGKHLWSSNVSHLEISVVPELNETVESVLLDLKIPLEDVTWDGQG